MAYLNCGRCGLEIRIQAAYLQIDTCPRCLARSAIVAPTTVSCFGWGSRAPDHHGDPRERGEPFPAIDTSPDRYDR